MSKDLRDKRNDVSRKAFNMMFRVLVYLLAPALIAVFLGKSIDAKLGTDKQWSLLCLGLAFILSWTLIIIDYKRLHHDIAELEREEQKHPGTNK